MVLYFAANLCCKFLHVGCTIGPDENFTEVIVRIRSCPRVLPAGTSTGTVPGTLFSVPQPAEKKALERPWFSPGAVRTSTCTA